MAKFPLSILPGQTLSRLVRRFSSFFYFPRQKVSSRSNLRNFTLMAFISSLWWQLILSLPILFVSHFLWQYIQSPLKSIPGPFLAKFTNLWRLLNILGGRSDLTHKRLHAKHGSAVRLGPNFVSLSDPSLIKVVYDARGKFVKVSQYIILETNQSGRTYMTETGAVA